MPKHINPLKLDPTRTTSLRRELMAAMRRRFRKLTKAIHELVVVENAFGLGLATVLPFGRERTEQINGPTLDDILTANTRWQFHTEDQKLVAYRAWLTEQVEAGVLEVSAAQQATPWLEPYIRSAYVKGLSRAYLDTRRAAIATSTDLSFVEGGKAQFLNDAFNSPVMQSKLKLLQTRAFSQLQGVTAAMDQEMSRTLATGLSAGHGARRIAKDLRENVGDLSKKRAMTIARTEIVHAHNEGQLDAFERLDVEEVGVMAEWNTAHDGRVCPLCRPLEGIILKISEARGMIPRHPNCRCAWIPAMVGEEDEGTTKTRFAGEEQEKTSTFKNPVRPTGATVGQTFSKDNINFKIRESLKAESPGRSAREARKRSKWTGADLKPAGSKRPRSVKKGAAPPTPPITPPVKPSPAKKRRDDLLEKEKAKTEALKKKLAATKAKRLAAEQKLAATKKAAAAKLKAEKALVPNPLDFGRPQGVTTTFTLPDDAKTFDGVAKDLFGKKVTRAEIAELAGATDGAEVQIFVQKGLNREGHKISINWTAQEGRAEAWRKVTIEDDKLVLSNGGFRIVKIKGKPPMAMGEGYGTRVFSQQVNAAERLGVNLIETGATRSAEMNGYYTWPRLGYDGTIPKSFGQSLEAVGTAFPKVDGPTWGIESRLSDLMKTSEGRAAWKKYGETVRVRFSVAKGAQSRRVLEQYVEAKQKQGTAKWLQSKKATSTPTKTK